MIKWLKKKYEDRQRKRFEEAYQYTLTCGRSQGGHDYEWYCVMCGRSNPCGCGLRSLFQRCKRCGKRGPNGGY